jgi:phosphohistidine swiveling domain-containing protein
MLPLSVNARRVKIAQKRFDGSQREFLTRMGAAKRHLRLGALYEMPGAFANMLFLVPFFAAPTERLAGRSFGMIADLGKPNLLVSVVLGVEFAVLATLMFPSEGRKRIATFVLSLVGLVVLAMVAVPSGVALYACGGLVITILAEVLAIRAASAAERTLELDKLANGDRKVSGECLALADAADLEEVGGKASALGKVASASLATRLFDVPGGVVFRNFEGLSIADDAKFNAAVLAHMKAKVPGAEAMKFAVRSSAPGEDSANESQAGRYVSVLNVTLDGIAEALRTVLTSYGEEAVKRGYRVGVLVQAMAPADLAGVMFTRSPGNGAVTHINYTEGLGDRLVSGEVAAKEIVVSRRSGVLRPKTSETRLAEKLFLAGQAIEKLFGRPQDIEWAYNRKEDKLYVLQSRPITVFEYDPAVLEEQEKHLATVPDLPRPEQVSRPVWKRSDVREVVENPSVLAASIVRRTYAKGGSLLVASDRLALGMGPVEVVSLFGQLYDKGGMSLLSNVRFALGMWRLKRGIEGSPWPAKLRAECEQPTPSTALDASEIRPLAAQLVAHVGVFLREVYPVAVEATILAKVATPEEPPKVHTISADMFASLVRAAESDDPSVFIKDWGQRSESDYDPAAPDFGEDVGALKAYAAGFRGMRVSDEVSSETPTAYSQLLQLKEISKDRAVRFLRRMRPAMLRLAALLKVAPSSVFVLPLESLEDLATGARSVDAIVAEIEDGVRREAAWKAVTLPDDVSVPDLEFLGQLAEEESEDASASSTSGKFVSAKNSFAGTVVHVSRITNDDDLTGAILVSDMLQPSLVKYFGKIAGIISERGAYLSHAAIVGREAGVPILILSKALSTVAHGSRVSVTVEGAVAVALSAAPAASLSPASIPGAMVAEAS